jgi:hypothetical protein
MRPFPFLLISLMFASSAAVGQSPYQSSTDFAKYAMKLRESALLKIEPQVFVPTLSRTSVSGRYPWHQNIVTTIFWIGERPTQNNPVPNNVSSWDKEWQKNYGGFDNPDPSARRNYIPVNFVPQQNPFYIALPYNDVTHGETKPEAPQAIPWFRDTFQRQGQSVCKDRWVAIRKGSRVAYAQWSDCGPFRTDHWQYVFGNDRPRPNLNQGAGLDVSPGVRDFLGLNSAGGPDVCDWKFVEFRDVPNGPWSKYGENNQFVLNARRSTERVASKASNNAGPTVITR